MNPGITAAKLLKLLALSCALMSSQTALAYRDPNLPLLCPLAPMGSLPYSIHTDGNNPRYTSNEGVIQDVNGTLTMVFNQGVLASDVNASTVYVIKHDARGYPLPGSVPGTLSVSGNTITFKPTTPFEPGRYYSMMVTGGVRGTTPGCDSRLPQMSTVRFLVKKFECAEDDWGWGIDVMVPNGAGVPLRDFDISAFAAGGKTSLNSHWSSHAGAYIELTFGPVKHRMYRPASTTQDDFGVNLCVKGIEYVPTYNQTGLIVQDRWRATHVVFWEWNHVWPNTRRGAEYRNVWLPANPTCRYVNMNGDGSNPGQETVCGHLRTDWEP